MSVDIALLNEPITLTLLCILVKFQEFSELQTLTKLLAWKYNGERAMRSWAKLNTDWFEWRLYCQYSSNFYAPPMCIQSNILYAYSHQAHTNTRTHMVLSMCNIKQYRLECALYSTHQIHIRSVVGWIYRLENRLLPQAMRLNTHHW